MPDLEPSLLRDVNYSCGRSNCRRASPISRAAILAALKSRIPQGLIEIEFIGGSTNEPGPFAHAIAEILSEAGWNVGKPDGGPSVGTPPSGLFILVASSAPTPERADLLKTALEAGGLTPRLSRAENWKPDVVTLKVGLKP